MTDETLGRIAEWCAAASDLDMDGNTVTVAGDPPVLIAVETGDDALILRHTHSVGEAHEAFAEKAKALLGGRGSMLEGDVATGKDGTNVEIRYPIYLDGLNRQTFLLAIRDITGTADGLVEIAASLPVTTAAASEPEDAFEGAVPITEPALVPAAEPDPEPVAGTAATVVVEPAPVWAPTHTVPGGGISAWAEPDPTLAPIAKLSARVELQVNEQRGAWARVTGSNGWTGWVDARKLRPLGAASAAMAPGGAPAATAATRPLGMTIRPLALLGGLAMLIAAFLPWNATGIALDGSYVIPFGKPMDWPFAFVWNQLSPGQPRLGIVVVILALVVLALALLPRVPAVATIVAGAVAVLIGVLFLFEFSRAPGWGDTFKILEVGFWVYLVGGVVAAIPFEMKN